MTRRSSRSTTIVFLLLAAGLALPGVAQLPPPTFPGAQWEQKAPSELGMNAAKLEEAKAYALTRNGAGFITRNGYLVASWGKSTDRYPLFSVTKAVGALLLGHAGKAPLGVTLDSKAQTHYAEFGALPVENQATPWLDDVTIEQLATHSAGFEKVGGAPRLKFEPGTRWVYSDGGANWLADVLTVKYGEDLESVLKREFLDHLGIPLRTNAAGALEWVDVPTDDPRGATIGAIPRRKFNAGISASVDAMARLGLLVERKGTWNGTELLPAAYVGRMVAPAASIASLPITDTGGAPDPHFPNATAHHGLFWWNNADGALPNVPTDAHWAWGLGDHLIVVIPSLSIVVARTSGQATEGLPRLEPNPWKNTDPNCVLSMCAHYDALDPFLTPIVQSVDGTPPAPPPPPGAPAITLTSDPTTVTAGSSATLTWSATNADACTASNGWTGAKAAQGTETVTVAQTTTYALSCTGAGGTTESSVTVTANAPAPAPPPAPAPTPTPPPADSGGGGGMVQWWMLLALAVLGGLRRAFVPGRRREPLLA